MKKTLFTLAITIMLCLFAWAQDSAVLRVLTARERPVVSGELNTERVMAMVSGQLPFCPPKRCLYYAGDFDSNNSNANGLYNANDTGESVIGETWVGVKPPRAVVVTGATFNELLTAGFTGTNPTPFQTQIDIVQGFGGKLVCNTTGNAVMVEYGEDDFGLAEYSYTIKKLKRDCKVQAGSQGATYINLLPTSTTGDGYVVDVEDAKPANHRGWKNDIDDSYFYAPELVYYEPTWGSSGVCGLGCDEFSVALTGKRK